jgi:hypothetical protein
MAGRFFGAEGPYVCGSAFQSEGFSHVEASRPSAVRPRIETRRFLAPHIRVVRGKRVAIALEAPIDTRLGAITALQRGRVARWQLLAIEVDGNAIDRRLRYGRLERISSGVYAVPLTSDLSFWASRSKSTPPGRTGPRPGSRVAADATPGF